VGEPKVSVGAAATAPAEPATEKAQVATINLLVPGERPKGLRAFNASSMRNILRTRHGRLVWAERDWGAHYNLMFSLCLRARECELLT